MVLAEVLSPITQASLAEIVTERIREAIIRGELAPDERITEVEISKVTQVSRSPVREAFKELESQGLLVRKEDKCLYVWMPTARDIEEIYSLRCMIEIMVAELIIDKIGEEDYRVLEQIIEDSEKAILAEDFLEITKLDLRFHDYLVRRTHHSRLINTWSPVMSQWAHLVYCWVKFDEKLANGVLVDHTLILDKYRNHDLQGLVDLHRQINIATSRVVKSALVKKGNNY